jgi:hypothetical protein
VSETICSIVVALVAVVPGVVVAGVFVTPFVDIPGEVVDGADSCATANPFRASRTRATTTRPGV